MDQSFKSRKSLKQSIEIMINNKILDINVSFPAKIKDYNITTQRATIIPLTKEEFYMFGPKGDIEIEEKPFGPFPRTYEQEVPPIPDVPVYCPSANWGECYIHMPLKKGDLGMCIVSTRSMEKYLSGGWTEDGECIPLTHNDSRHHDFSDAWFVPGVLPNNKELSGLLPDDMVLRNSATSIELDPLGKIAIKNDLVDELITLLINIIKQIQSSKYNTMMGPQPMFAPDFAALGLLITDLETYKK